MSNEAFNQLDEEMQGRVSRTAAYVRGISQDIKTAIEQGLNIPVGQEVVNLMTAYLTPETRPHDPQGAIEMIREYMPAEYRKASLDLSRLLGERFKKMSEIGRLQLIVIVIDANIRGRIEGANAAYSDLEPRMKAAQQKKK